MRLIVACRQCKRQYDASSKQPGHRFRCHCGEALVVEQPAGHEASVVRCASCGAPREQGASACTHCGADFTIHEQDLHTVCPNCLARISDRAKFCHHCATRLMPEMMAGDESQRNCPVCGPETRLRSRLFARQQVAVLECQVCAGLWLGIESFRAVLEHEQNNPRPATTRNEPLRTRQPGPRYRHCVVCGEIMMRRNFGRGGVIVDICGRHGIWFDADELSQLIAWVRSGNIEKALTDLARLSGSKDAVRRREALQQEQPRREEPRQVSSDPFSPFAPGAADPFDEIADAAIHLIGRLFRKS